MLQFVRTGIEVVGCRNQGGRAVVENDDDVGTPPGVIDDDYRPVRCSGMESVEGRWLQEVVKSRQGLYLRNKLLAIVQKFPLPHHEMAKWIHLLDVTVFTTKVYTNTNVVVR